VYAGTRSPREWSRALPVRVGAWVVVGAGRDPPSRALPFPALDGTDRTPAGKNDGFEEVVGLKVPPDVVPPPEAATRVEPVYLPDPNVRTPDGFA
jgi:hypothetical protein